MNIEVGIKLVSGLPLVVGLLELAKKYIDKKYVPILSIPLGILFVVAVSGFSIPTVLTGIALGLTACGLYDQSYLVTKKIQK